LGVASLPAFVIEAALFERAGTASTLFASTKLPLTTWFLAIYLLSQA